RGLTHRTIVLEAALVHRVAWRNLECSFLIHTITGSGLKEAVIPLLVRRGVRATRGLRGQERGRYSKCILRSAGNLTTPHRFARTPPHEEGNFCPHNFKQPIAHTPYAPRFKRLFPARSGAPSWSRSILRRSLGRPVRGQRSCARFRGHPKWL